MLYLQQHHSTKPLVHSKAVGVICTAAHVKNLAAEHLHCNNSGAGCISSLSLMLVYNMLLLLLPLPFTACL
jgi:hypothetical protein